MTNSIKLTFTQCKQIVANNCNLREFAEQVNEQPLFMTNGMGIDDIAELQAILNSGCAANAHKSVYYYDAAQHMENYGDSVLEYIEDQMGELPTIPNDTSWSQIASFYLVTAIELWCGQFSDVLDGVDWD